VRLMGLPIGDGIEMFIKLEADELESIPVCMRLALLALVQNGKALLGLEAGVLFGEKPGETELTIARENDD